MFAKSLIAAAALIGSSAWAHGNLAHQAQEAVTTALETFQKSEPRERMRLFKSVSAELIAHETFTVLLGFTDKANLTYRCWEDETVSPVIWKCEKQ